MRDYSKVVGTFWTGETGKALRRRGPEAVIVAAYLMTSPHSNMLGLYYQPLLYLAHETGLGLEGASKGLTHCVEVGYCDWDQDTEMVWVREMAKFQIGKELKAGDNRCLGVQREYDALPNCPFLGPFFDRYAAAFHMKSRRSTEGATEAPSKPLGSQEHEQEQEQEQEQASLPAVDAADAASSAGKVVELSQDQRTVEIVLDCYHRLLPKCQRVEALTPKRRKRILAANKLARDLCRRQGWSLTVRDFWTAYFEECLEDPWLSGDVPNPKNLRWKQNLCLLLDEERFGQIMDKAVAKARADDPREGVA